eukprot:4253839-Alexandrium_andersonii.AAC.1
MGFSAKELCRKMAAPTITDWAALVRLTRYLFARPRCVYRFPWYVDTDFAGRLRARRSTCEGVGVKGLRAIKH